MYYFLSDAVSIVGDIAVAAIYFFVWYGIYLAITRGIVRGVLMNKVILKRISDAVSSEFLQKKKVASIAQIVLLSLLCVFVVPWSIYMIVRPAQVTLGFLQSFAIIGGMIAGTMRELSTEKREKWTKEKVIELSDPSRARV